ncbi:hypothetical protein EJ02DRAFT_514346 [Clathrospora elynae]|uniref:Uncharacterized protein n=1 Tax=Clathrospora elynae TaxID=706981 RepID=A0A6A5SGG4_9PLEO|nr:hypothetical protein EJ02DRAFT_514346 [Clathrospora elynae]
MSGWWCGLGRVPTPQSETKKSMFQSNYCALENGLGSTLKDFYFTQRSLLTPNLSASDIPSSLANRYGAHRPHGSSNVHSANPNLIPRFPRRKYSSNMPFRKAFASLGRKKGKEVQAQLQASSFESQGAGNVPEQGRENDRRGKSNTYQSLGRREGRQVVEKLRMSLAKDAASDIFKRVVREDTIAAYAPRTDPLTHNLAFLVHTLPSLHKLDGFLPMFQYGPDDIFETNRLSLGANRLQSCIKKISNGYTQGVLLERMPLYVLETNFLAACACAKTFQLQHPTERIAVAIVDIASLKRDQVVVSPSQIFKTLRVVEPITLQEKVLVWAEEWNVGTAENPRIVRPLRDALLAVIDWRRLQTSRIGGEWFPELRRSPDISIGNNSLDIYKSWRDGARLFQYPNLPVQDMFVELWVHLGLDLNNYFTKQLGQTLMAWSLGALNTKKFTSGDVAILSQGVDKAFTALLEKQNASSLETTGENTEDGKLGMHTIEDMYIEWRGQELQAREASSPPKTTWTIANPDVEQPGVPEKSLFEAPQEGLEGSSQQPLVHETSLRPETPASEKTIVEESKENKGETNADVYREPAEDVEGSSPKVEGLAAKTRSSSTSDTQSLCNAEQGKAGDAGVVSYKVVEEDEEQVALTAGNVAPAPLKPFFRLTVNRDTPTRLGRRVPGAF